MSKKTFYLTTAISYVNGAPHIGHAYEAIAGDVMARFKRLDGYDVFAMTGTDEYGQKVEKSAIAAGRDPQQLCDENAELFKQMNAMAGTSYDRFIRTTEPAHRAAAQAIWQALEKNGDIYLNKYSGWYSTRDEAFYGEDEVTTNEAGKKISTVSGTEVEWTEEESYFFRLSAYGDRLLELYEKNPDFIHPASSRNEVISFVKSGLRDLSISRTSFKWGVPVPGNDRHIMYVWLDALTNYLTGVGYPDTNAESFKKYWPCDVHLIGKDIVRFHAVYWPAFLMSVGLPVQKRVFAHGMLLRDGQKMSKSLGNTVSPQYLIETYGVEQIRYYLMREVIFGNDGDVADQLIVNRINADLANNIGNLAQRTLSFIAKNAGSVVPQPGDMTQADKDLLAKAHTLLDKCRVEFDKMQFSRALDEVMAVATAANLYIDEQAPWTLKKNGDTARMNTVLYVLAEAIRNIALLLLPVTPNAAAKLLEQVGEQGRDFSACGASHALKPGTPLPAPAGVFPRIEAKAA